MAINLKYGPVGTTFLAAYGAGKNKYQNRREEETDRLIRQQGQMQFERDEQNRRFQQQQLIQGQQQVFQRGQLQNRENAINDRAAQRLADHRRIANAQAQRRGDPLPFPDENKQAALQGEIDPRTGNFVFHGPAFRADPIPQPQAPVPVEDQSWLDFNNGKTALSKPNQSAYDKYDNEKAKTLADHTRSKAAKDQAIADLEAKQKELVRRFARPIPTRREIADMNTVWADPHTGAFVDAGTPGAVAGHIDASGEWKRRDTGQAKLDEHQRAEATKQHAAIEKQQAAKQEYEYRERVRVDTLNLQQNKHRQEFLLAWEEKNPEPEEESDKHDAWQAKRDKAEAKAKKMFPDYTPIQATEEPSTQSTATPTAATTPEQYRAMPGKSAPMSGGTPAVGVPSSGGGLPVQPELTPGGVPKQQQSVQPREVTKEEYDQLPPGTPYLRNGKAFIKG